MAAPTVTVTVTRGWQWTERAAGGREDDKMMAQGAEDDWEEVAMEKEAKVTSDLVEQALKNEHALVAVNRFREVVLALVHKLIPYEIAICIIY